MFAIFSCKGQEEHYSKKDQAPLATSPSPYLRMHADNPVNWHTWGDRALDSARARNDLLIVSVGYTACHWCHVMEKESFMDSSVARIMNEHYVPIKVDRENRPAVDERYMKWKRVLEQVNEQWQKDPERIREQARKIEKGIASMNRPPALEGDSTFVEADLDSVFESKWAGKLDREHGGGQGAPKFPMPIQYHHLMGYAQLSGNTLARRAVEEGLTGMARGGVYDHVGGGFHRYSTDAEWKVPHFEKMLYDNGQLMELYSDAYRWSGKKLYERTVKQSMGFIERELRDSSGAFFASLSAVVDGVEGKPYTWTLDELKEVLTDTELEQFRELYPVSRSGNWKDGRNVLHRQRSIEAVARDLGVPIDSLRTELAGWMKKLREERSKRELPQLDDKRITAWNGMMISGLTAAYRALDEPRYLKMAEKCAERFWSARDDGKGLFPRTLDRPGRTGYLDDHAFMIKAFLDLYEAGFDEKWLLRAEDLTQTTLEQYGAEQIAPFLRYQTPSAEEVKGSPQLKLTDGTIPSPNSTMAHQLFRLHQMRNRPEWAKRATRMLRRVKEKIPERPVHHSNWARLILLQVHQPYQVAIVGKKASAKKDLLEARYFPNVFYLGGEREGELELLQNKLVEGETRIYVCRDRVCKRPVKRVEEALEQLSRDQ